MNDDTNAPIVATPIVHPAIGDPKQATIALATIPTMPIVSANFCPLNVSVLYTFNSVFSSSRRWSASLSAILIMRSAEPGNTFSYPANADGGGIGPEKEAACVNCFNCEVFLVCSSGRLVLFDLVSSLLISFFI